MQHRCPPLQKTQGWGASLGIVHTDIIKDGPPAFSVLGSQFSVFCSLWGGLAAAFAAAVPVQAKADLAIVKTSDKLIYKPSSVITYTIAVTNNGPSDALAVIVTDN